MFSSTDLICLFVLPNPIKLPQSIIGTLDTHIDICSMYWLPHLIGILYLTYAKSDTSFCCHFNPKLACFTREFQKNISFCCIDYAKAFDCVGHNKLWKILKEMGISDHLICLLRNLYAGQEATVRTRRGTTDWFQIGKGVHQGCILSPCLFNLYAEYIMRNARLEEA